MIGKESAVSWKKLHPQQAFDLWVGRWAADLVLPDDEEMPEITIEKLTVKLQRTVFLQSLQQRIPWVACLGNWQMFQFEQAK